MQFLIRFDLDPEIYNLKIFGNAVYPLLRPFTAIKLQPRAIQCVFIGFAMGYKGVICYDIKSRKFIVSRHAVHDEDVYPFKYTVWSIVNNNTISCYNSLT